MKNTYLYDDIIDLPHHVSKTRTPMPISERAGQFAPFAALTGYDDEVKETARLVDREILLEDEEKEMINSKLNVIETFIKDKPLVTITYFIDDGKKSGGKYEEITSNIRRIDSVKKVLILTDKQEIMIDKIIDIRGNIFKDMI